MPRTRLCLLKKRFCLTWTAGLTGGQEFNGWQDFHGAKGFPEQDLPGWQDFTGQQPLLEDMVERSLLEYVEMYSSSSM